MHSYILLTSYISFQIWKCEVGIDSHNVPQLVTFPNQSVTGEEVRSAFATPRGPLSPHGNNFSNTLMLSTYRLDITLGPAL